MPSIEEVAESEARVADIISLQVIAQSSTKCRMYGSAQCQAAMGNGTHSQLLTAAAVCMDFAAPDPGMFAN